MSIARWIGFVLMAFGLLVSLFAQEGEQITIPPQIMTYEQLARLLTTPERPVYAEDSLKRRAILIHLKERSWDEARRLLEYGLELQIRQYSDDQGNPYWLIERDPETAKRDARFFDQYVRVVTQQIQDDLKRYDALLAQPLKSLQEAFRNYDPPDQTDSEAVSLTLDTPFPEDLRRHAEQGIRLYWAQSLDGYVMLRWMRRHWNEHLTRKMIRERGLIMLQPRALGLEGLDEEALTSFIRVGWYWFPEDTPADPKEAYDLAMGVVGWDPATRHLIPYADLLSPLEAGTGWLIFPVHVKTEPLYLEALFRQMSPEALRFVQELDQRQREMLQGDSPLKKPFRIRKGSWLSEILQQYALQLDHEVLMELAPEQEWTYGAPAEIQMSLQAVLSAPTPLVLSPDSSNENPGWLTILAYQVREDEEETASHLLLYSCAHCLPDLPEHASARTLQQALSERLRNIWRFEQHEGVLIARNLLGFLSRIYDYPFEALVELERQAVVGSDGIPRIPPEARWRFVHALSRAPSNAIPAIAGYRMTRYLEADTQLWTLLALLDRMPNKQHYWKRLQRGERVEIPFTMLGADAGDRLLNLWRMNTFYYGGLKPFGYRHAWHPDFMLYLRRGRVSLFPSEDGISVSILWYVWNPESSEWDARIFSVGEFSWAWLGEPPQTTPSSR
ncbi:hypothetical protein GBSOP10_10641 [Armatimonadetes bacterium GBS]|nr:hypothetical protein HRbin14_00025 [bacterium HR14]GIV14288.1 MAG: hypothetical protein KatS3mg021_2570 [Fimbriimonadales bacterium]CUU10139.1 hypothetical protein GBSOP10_10641 [Armatimonadetes bacterium GBS]CUU37123.1 hypothetical protein GXSOP10_13019 [Armatimonadetes bacterium GXS]